MKQKASLLLMEQLVLLLAFSLAAAVSLGIFANSHHMARENEHREAAALLAQNAAQLLKSGEDLDILDTGSYDLTVEPLASPVPGYLKKAQIFVSLEGEVLFTLEAAWQEVGP